MNTMTTTTGEKEWLLLTGANGFLGTGFVASLDEETRARCVCIVRKATHELAASVAAVVEGDFNDADSLNKLAPYKISTAVHLAAVTGGCSEKDGMAVNVEGTRVLMRYLIDRGCRRFVLASSIAAVGLQRVDFRPLRLPMDEAHPCLDKDGYGFSKFLMEEVARYYQRQNAHIAVTCLRFGVICPDEAKEPSFVPSSSPPAWTYAHFSKVLRKDAVRAINLAIDKTPDGVFRVMNIVARQSALSVPVSDLIACWSPGAHLDLSAYASPGHERDAVFSTELARGELGFVADWAS
jgi:UDP-glucose 4-epimerase